MRGSYWLGGGTAAARARSQAHSPGAVRRLFARLGVPAEEWACLIPVLLLAAADRLVNLPARGLWDTDQGYETGAIWNAVVTRQLPTFGSPAFTTGGGFHHGALFYDLMIPFAWLGNGNPAVIVAAIALFGLAVVPLVWWTARSIGGTSAGLAAALLAAVSPSLIDYSTFIWNPVLIQFGVALACIGAWQAWTTRRPRWWIVAAAGTAIASQAHLTGLVLVFPISFFFLVTLRCCPAPDRRRLLAWGLAGVALFVLTWSLWLFNELTHDLVETRAILAFDQGGPPAANPIIRLVVGVTRITAWPISYWPLDDFKPGFPIALIVAAGITAGLIWRVIGAIEAARSAGGGPDAGVGDAMPALAPTARPAPGNATPRQAARNERNGLLFVGGSLLFITLVLSLGIKEISQISNLNQEQYHAVADVLVILAAGLIVGGLWRSAPLRGRAWSGHIFAAVVIAGLVATGVSHWPPLTAPDGGWPVAQAAATRLERDAGTPELALANLPYFKTAETYSYPLELDGVKIVAPSDAKTVVILCDSGWYQGCGGAAETDWLAANLPGASFSRTDLFEPSPQRFLSVYQRTP